VAHLLLAGYLGSGNLGDDAILAGFLACVDERHEITVLSGAPEETFRSYKVRAVPRRDMRAVDEAVERCDALVFPGGSVFQDATSVRSVAYYHRLVKLAKTKRKKVALLGQGVGPVSRFFGKKLTSTAYNLADLVAVRDPASAALLKEIGVRQNVRITADLAFLLPPPPPSDDGAFNVGNMRTVAIAPRPLKGKDIDVVELFGQFCRLLYQSGTMPVLLEMDRAEDGPLIREISKRQGGKIPDVRNLQMPGDVQRRLSRMELVVAMRLHAGILSTTVGVPPMMVSYDPKVAAFAKLLEVGPALSLQGLTPIRMLDAFTEFQRARDRNVKIVEQKRVEMCNLAQTNLDLLEEILQPTATMG
jgi:polysaccharide pyruvyl transferase CsaB